MIDLLNIMEICGGVWGQSILISMNSCCGCCWMVSSYFQWSQTVIQYSILSNFDSDYDKQEQLLFITVVGFHADSMSTIFHQMSLFHFQFRSIALCCVAPNESTGTMDIVQIESMLDELRPLEALCPYASQLHLSMATKYRYFDV